MSLLDRAIALALPAIPKPIVRQFSRRYIAGTTMPQAFAVARELATAGAMTTIDILGEFTSDAAAARRGAAAYEELLRRIRDEGLLQTNVSVKLSALGLLLDPALCLEGMRGVLQVAAQTDNFVRIDMEDSSCTDATLDVYRRLRAEFPGRVGVVLQARLRRTLRDLSALSDGPCNFRLCKGIYVEPRRLAYTDAEIVRRNFVSALEQMLDAGAYVGIATHDERLVWEALRLIAVRRLDRRAYEFQMLLGVDEELRRILIADGHRLRVYVPYGEQWYAYSVRRLRENPQIAGYALRAVFKSR